MEKIVIIGAGPAGITAGYELLKSGKDYEVTILEETQELGGISKTVCHNGNRMDIGGHRFFSKDKEVNRWWTEILPLQGKGTDPNCEDCVMLDRHRFSSILYQNQLFDYPVSLNCATIRNMGLCTTLQVGLSYLWSCIHKLPEDSLENFYRNRFGTKLYRMFFESYTEKLWGRHPRDISPDWGAQRVKGLSIMEIIRDYMARHWEKGTKGSVESSLIERFWYPKYGPGQLWEEAAGRFVEMGGTILKGCKAERVLTDGARVTEVCARWEGKELHFAVDYCISSMPLSELIKGMEDVPQNITDIAAGLPYRSFVTVGVLLSDMTLKKGNKQSAGGLTPDCWIYVQDKRVKLGRIQIFNNWSPYLVKDAQNHIWLGLEYFCGTEEECWSYRDTKWRELAVSELLKLGMIEAADRVLDYHVERVEKAYPAYFGTYEQLNQLVDYLNGYENLYCVGRNGQHRYNNMDHSMLTAFRAVGHISGQGNTTKEDVWKVNVEQEYHEEK